MVNVKYYLGKAGRWWVSLPTTGADLLQEICQSSPEIERNLLKYCNESTSVTALQ